MSINSADIKKMSFETAVEELEEIVNNFEGGQINLEQSIAQYTRAAQLKGQCEKKLTEAKLKVEKIIANDDGSISTTKFPTD